MLSFSHTHLNNSNVPMDVMREDSKTDVVAHINYFPALGTPIPTSAWKKRFLGVSDEYTRLMTICDARNLQDVDLDVNGFKYLQLTPKQRVDSMSTEEVIRQEYYRELEDLAKSLYATAQT